MIRQLKPLAQLEVLIVAEIQKDQKLKAVKPRLALVQPPAPGQCNWTIAAWDGPVAQVKRAEQAVDAKVDDLQKRYNAVGFRANRP